MNPVAERRREYGGIAQLGERLNGIQEVSGSIPLISTKSEPDEPSRRIFCRSGFCPGHAVAKAAKVKGVAPFGRKVPPLFVRLKQDSP